MSKQQKKPAQWGKKWEECLIKNIEKEYKVDFGVRSDMKLGTYLKSRGLPSLSKALDKASKIK